MHICRLQSTILVILSILAVSILAAKITTTTLKPTQSTKSKIPAKATQKPSNATRKVITTRLGADGNAEQQCECTLFYLCEQVNVVTLPATGDGERCDATSVCCASPTLVTDTTPSWIPVTSETSVTSVTPGTSGQCQCVPFFECADYNSPVTTSTANYGEGIIIPKIPCDLPDVCCPLSSIITTTSGPTTSTPVTQTNITPITPTPVSPNVEECGVRRVQPIDKKIANRISGTDVYTSFGEFPWMAIILTTQTSITGETKDNVFVCGASLLSPTIILTAAHCVEGMNINSLTVRVGEYDTNDTVNEPFPYQDRSVISLHVHPNFNSKVLFNDLALLSVNEPFQFAAHVSPICTPLVNSDYAAPDSYNPSRCVATGWGKDAFGVNERYQTTMRRVDLHIMPRDECLSRLRSTRLGPTFQLESSFICAAGQRGSDTCEGDGGGPLVCELRNYPGRYVQVGIVSWGIGCGTDVPGVYASLEANRDWLTTEFNSMSVFRRAKS